MNEHEVGESTILRENITEKCLCCILGEIVLDDVRPVKNSVVSETVTTCNNSSILRIGQVSGLTCLDSPSNWFGTLPVETVLSYPRSGRGRNIRTSQSPCG